MRLSTLALISTSFLLVACASDQANNAGGVTQQPYPSTNSATTGHVNTAPVSQYAAGSADQLQHEVGDTINYAFDSSELTAAARATLERQAAWLQVNSGVNVRIAGHCDERGTREYNLALGDRRANTAKNYLVALGVSASRIATISYGEEHPVAAGANEEAWAENRRGVTTITAVSGM